MPTLNTTLSPVTVQRFSALQGELVGLIEQDYMGLTPKLEQIIRAFELTQIELAVYRDRGYAQGRGVGQPEADRCALACAFLAKAVLDLKTTRALIDCLQADSKLRRLYGFDLRFALPSESILSRAVDEFASGELIPALTCTTDSRTPWAINSSATSAGTLRHTGTRVDCEEGQSRSAPAQVKRQTWALQKRRSTPHPRSKPTAAPAHPDAGANAL
jgi:Transposase domain (DUF772)